LGESSQYAIPPIIASGGYMQHNFIDKAWASWCATIIILGVFVIVEGMLLVPKDAWAAALSSPTDELGFEKN